MAAYDEHSVLMRGREESKRRRGRPKKEEKHMDMVSLRLEDEDMDMLRHLEIESDDTRSDILRKALRTYYHIRSKKW